MATVIKQGDAYEMELSAALRDTVTGAETSIPIADIEKIEVYVGDEIRKLYPGEITYDEEQTCFYMQLTQEDTFSLPEGEMIELDIRIKFDGGGVLGSKKKQKIRVSGATSKKVL